MPAKSCYLQQFLGIGQQLICECAVNNSWISVNNFGCSVNNFGCSVNNFWMSSQQFLDVQSTISVNNLLASSNLTARDNCTKHGYLSSTIHDYLIPMGWHVYVLNYVGD